MTTKPFQTYNGGKAGNGTYQQIINHIPKCEFFIDAFVGNGGIFFNLKLPEHTVINDIDPGIIDKYNNVAHTDKNTYVSQGVRKENLDYGSLIDKYDCTSSLKTFFYFDPPYLKSTRKSEKNLYKFDWNENDHNLFLSLAVKVKSDCMISHYPCDLYNNSLKDWRFHDFQSITRNGLRTERIYMNYSKPLILQDYKYLGKDFIDRQRIKRKVKRFIAKLDNMQADERTAILKSVIDKYSYTSAILFNHS